MPRPNHEIIYCADCKNEVDDDRQYFLDDGDLVCWDCYESHEISAAEAADWTPKW